MWQILFRFSPNPYGAEQLQDHPVHERGADSIWGVIVILWRGVKVIIFIATPPYSFNRSNPFWTIMVQNGLILAKTLGVRG